MSTAYAQLFDYSKQIVYPTACPVCGTDNPSVPTRDRYGYAIGVSQCKTCSLRYLNPRMDVNGYSDFYRDAYRPLVEQYAGVGKTEGEARGRGIGRLLQRKGVQCRRLLDVGGGTGAVAAGISEILGAPTVMIVDPNIDELKQARERGFFIRRGLIETLQPEEQYDLVCSILTSDHWLDPIAALRWLRQSCVDGGHLWVDMVDMPAFQKRYPRSNPFKVDHPLAWSVNSFARALRETGWRVRGQFSPMGQPHRRDYLCEGV